MSLREQIGRGVESRIVAAGSYPGDIRQLPRGGSGTVRSSNIITGEVSIKPFSSDNPIKVKGIDLSMANPGRLTRE